MSILCFVTFLLDSIKPNASHLGKKLQVQPLLILAYIWSDRGSVVRQGLSGQTRGSVVRQGLSGQTRAQWSDRGSVVRQGLSGICRLKRPIHCIENNLFLILIRYVLGSWKG